MGRDKARLRVGAALLWRRQVAVLAAAGARPVMLALRPRQRSFGAGAPEVRDTVEGAGPMGGLHAALAASPAPWLAVLAVDMARVDAGWFRRLRRRCRAGVGAVVVEPEGFQPLAAIYPRAALGVVEGRMRRRRFALQGLVAELVKRGRMVAVRVPAAERWRAANWNFPSDIRPGRGTRRASALPRAGPPEHAVR
jgi:molybdenum cofactor guanylyltransferase